MTRTSQETRIEGEKRFLLPAVRWQTYQMLLEDIGDYPIRITYDKGGLELMTPLFNHERCKRLLGRVVEILAEESGVDYIAGGATTFRREDLERGLEPDDCFYVAHWAQIKGKDRIDLQVDPPPDLALEVDITSSSLNRMSIYAALGVGEIWRTDGVDVQFHRLTEQQDYEVVQNSRIFPDLSCAVFAKLLPNLLAMNDREMTTYLRQWIRKDVLKKSTRPTNGSV